MFIVALYLVIKEHKICLCFFLCEHSLIFFPSIFLLGQGGYMHPFHMRIPFNLFSTFCSPFYIDSSDMFTCTRNCFLSDSLFLPASLSVSFLQVELGHKFGRLLWFPEKRGQIFAEAKNRHDVTAEQNKTLSSLCYNFVRMCTFFVSLHHIN